MKFNYIKITEQKINIISEILFFSGYLLWLVWKFSSVTVVSLPEESGINSLIHWVSIVLLILPFLTSLRNKNVLIWAFVSCSVGIFVRICANNIIIFDLAFILTSSTNVSFKKIAKTTLVVSGTLLLFTIVLSQTGLIVDYPFSRTNSTVRHGLGFLWCTYSSQLFMYLVLLYFCLSKKNVPWLTYLVIILMNIWLYIMTDTRNPFVLVLLACVISILYKTNVIKKNIAKNVTILIKPLPIIILVASLVCTYLYDSNSNEWKNLNEFTSYRISKTQASFYKYGLEPFGQKITFVSSVLDSGNTSQTSRDENPEGDTNYVDSSLLTVLVQYGYITLFWCMLILMLSIRALHNREHYFTCALFSIILLHSVFDPQLFILYYNTFLFLMWQVAVKTQVRLPKVIVPTKMRAKHAR